MIHGTSAGDNRVAAFIGNLAEYGYAVAPGFLAPSLSQALAEEACALDWHEETGAGGVGRADQFALDENVRKSRIHWLDRTTPARRAFLDMAEDLRLAINRRLFMGLFEFEAQYGVYDEGGFYVRHVDSLAGSRNRMVSMVAYLNPDWRPEDGGELEIWRDEDGLPVATVLPEAGTVVLMLSEEIPHQVRPTARKRLSIAGWYRVNQTHGRRVDPPS